MKINAKPRDPGVAPRLFENGGSKSVGCSFSQNDTRWLRSSSVDFFATLQSAKRPAIRGSATALSSDSQMSGRGCEQPGTQCTAFRLGFKTTCEQHMKHNTQQASSRTVFGFSLQVVENAFFMSSPFLPLFAGSDMSKSSAMLCLIAACVEIHPILAPNIAHNLQSRPDREHKYIISLKDAMHLGKTLGKGRKEV